MEKTGRRGVCVMLDTFTIRLLGPVDVVTTSGAVGVGGRKARALLGALAVGAGHAVSIDHLQDVLWSDSPPDSADNSLQSYISHLRHLLSPEAIRRVDHSYELTVRTANIDALVFEQLVTDAAESRGNPERCREICRDALKLWRGRPFGDLADEEAFRLEAYRLDELRLVAMEMALEAELALGHADLIVGELESAVEEHPYREHLWHLLIAALAQCDRRVEALRACGRLRSELREVGLTSSEELDALEQDVLAGRIPVIAQ